MIHTFEMKTHLRKVHAQAIGSALERRWEQGKHCEVNGLSTCTSTIHRYYEIIGG